ncbi:PRC-barrel domain-containing protein [Adhaeribacter aquaticus]|uniref:PRC-barrel domain-containing protein n=1 Tax=Adhaeribacter aquaticus TaxID=299567 RepID=UPI00047A892A|nr:PRC-barrel domain-containing protein [Adhaeribacter aquaticus]
MRNDNIKYVDTDRLVPLSGMKDYEIAKDNPNVLGWRVVGSDGEYFGVVRDLIFDPTAMKVRYLYVVAERKFFKSEYDPYLLIPIGAAALDKKRNNIFVSFIDSNSLSNYPVYGGGPIPEDYEYSVRDLFMKSQHNTLHPTSDQNRTDYDIADHRNTDHTFSDNNQVPLSRPAAAQPLSNDFYASDYYNENRFYNAPEDTGTYDTNRNSSTFYDTNEPFNTDNQDNNPKSVEDSIATIERLEQLRERGSITNEEFAVLKRRALGI